MLCQAFRLFLGNKARPIGRQLRIDDIIWDIITKLYCAAPFAGEVLLQFLTCVDEPEVLRTALQAAFPAHPVHQSTRSAQPSGLLADRSSHPVEELPRCFVLNLKAGISVAVWMSSWRLAVQTLQSSTGINKGQHLHYCRSTTRTTEDYLTLRMHHSTLTGAETPARIGHQSLPADCLAVLVGFDQALPSR